MTDRSVPGDGAPPFLSLADAERAARAVLAPDVWDFVAGGSGDESVLAGNRAALDAVRLVPRVLTGAVAADPAGTLLGARLALPLALAPMAYQRLVHPEGELALARAARESGALFIAGVLNSLPLEELARAAGPAWFQLYWLRDRSLTEQLIDRAEAAGYRALVITVDVPVMGRRLRDMRNSFALPHDIPAANLAPRGTIGAHRRAEGTSAVSTHTARLFAPGPGWPDLAWLRARTRLPLVLKGVLHPEDAVRAVEAGVDALVVSNHGGRQLDGAVASVAALPPVVRAVAGRCPVLLDSGVRGGTDVLRALALGASGALLGRPALWGLAAAGESGVRDVLRLLRAELEEAMLLSGCGTLADAGSLTTTV
ncbi:alpha-hydroxy-acid oxidizing protein [Streptomyces carpaticus]|uniref:alpha-hydroxy acid oxidase n=1 Tax=Streptomyces TaxID=1883 RepID=UPI0022045D0C|nr:alpha-hydroxy-acid oxidizing protein [Streptomyces carpaticus]